MQILVVLMVTIIALLWHHKSKGYYELIEELGCHDTEFRLACASFNANIAIFEATFSQNDTFLEPLNTSCGNPGHPPNQNAWKLHKLKDWENVFHRKTNADGVVEVNFRHAINRRCSGVNYCSFILSEDFEEGARLGPGAIYLRYACVDDVHVTRACNSNINVSSEGFVRTPGYPNYYIGDSSCLWTLNASPPQRVKVTFLDVSLRGTAPHEDKCLDLLVVTEDGLNLLSGCGDIVENTVIISDSSNLNVTFKTSSKTLFPKRGFLFHYKAVGCPGLEKPRDGYLINRNETSAHFRCCIGFVFPDVMSRDKILNCYNENTWSGDVVDCVNVTQILKEETDWNKYSRGNFTSEARAAAAMPEDMLQNIIIPSAVICFLFTVAIAILICIFRLRKKQEEEELEECSESDYSEESETRCARCCARIRNCCSSVTVSKCGRCCRGMRISRCRKCCEGIQMSKCRRCCEGVQMSKCRRCCEGADLSKCCRFE